MYVLFIRVLVLIVLMVLSFSVRSINAENPPGVIIDYWPAETKKYIGDPSIVILPDGSYVASHDGFGPRHRAYCTYLFGSQDSGKTWQPVGIVRGQSVSTLFVHNGSLFMIGVGGDSNGQFIGIRKSNDGGRTWTIPKNGDVGRLLISK